MKPSTAAGLLREIRESQSRSLREAASELGVAPSYLSRVERGERSGSESLTNRMAEYYGVSPDLVTLAEGRLPADIAQIVRDHPEVIDELRRRFGHEQRGTASGGVR